MAAVYPCKHLGWQYIFEPMQHFSNRHRVAGGKMNFAVVALAFYSYNVFGLYQADATVVGDVYDLHVVYFIYWLFPNIIIAGF
jgi:hypothetical protein